MQRVPETNQLFNQSTDQHLPLVPPHVPSLHIIHKCLVHYAVSTRCWIVSGKVPVAKVIWTGFMQVLYTLEDHINRNFKSRWCDQLRDLTRQFSNGELFV